MTLTSKQLTKLKKIFKCHQVELAYLFGSAASGKTTPLSDIDLAVLFGKSRKNQFTRQLNLLGDLNSFFKRDDIDLVVLNTSDPLISYNAVIKGHNIYSKNQVNKLIFEYKTLTNFEDHRHLYHSTYNLINSHIKHGTFGKPLIKNYYVSYR